MTLSYEDGKKLKHNSPPKGQRPTPPVKKREQINPKGSMKVGVSPKGHGGPD